MSYRIMIEGFSVVVQDAINEKHILLDGVHTFRNVSKRSLQSFNNSKTVVEYLLDIQDEYNKIIYGINECTLIPFLINCVVSNYLVEKVHQVHVLEIGCEKGMVSWNLIKTLKLFHEKSFLCCVSNVIGNESGNDWLDKVVECVNDIQVALHISDYDQLYLLNRGFEIVVVNDVVRIEQDDIWEQTKKLLADNGIIICHYKGDVVELESKLYKRVKKYERIVLDFNEILVIIHSNDLMYDEPCNWEEDIMKLLSMTEEKIINGRDNDKEQIKSLIYCLENAILQSIEKEKVDDKVQLINEKRKLIDLLVELEM